MRGWRVGWGFRSLLTTESGSGTIRLLPRSVHRKKPNWGKNLRFLIPARSPMGKRTAVASQRASGDHCRRDQPHVPKRHRKGHYGYSPVRTADSGGGKRQRSARRNLPCSTTTSRVATRLLFSPCAKTKHGPIGWLCKAAISAQTLFPDLLMVSSFGRIYLRNSSLLLMGLKTHCDS